LPANRLVFGPAGRFEGLGADSLASAFGFGLGDSFGFGFAVAATVGTGVGLSGTS
jgi:hypothetical protein